LSDSHSTSSSSTLEPGTARDSMWALVVEGDTWDTERGFRKTRVPRPTLNEQTSHQDSTHVIVQVLYAGVCGTDRGIYDRASLKSTVLRALKQDKVSQRIIGHELVGRIAEVGSDVKRLYGYEPDQIVSTESHIFCGRCYQCRQGQMHICSDDRIIGVSRDGGFAEYIKLPARVLWPTDTKKVSLEVAAIQEPFGNAVHACTRVDLRGKTVGVFGMGPIGLFAVMIAKSLGATRVVGIEPSEERRALALEAGADAVFEAPITESYEAAPELTKALWSDTDGVGLDVALEMSGFNSSLNNALAGTRRGGEVVLFGLHGGDWVVQNYEQVILKGLTLYSVIGREIFRTWTFTQRLLEDTDNGIQKKIHDLLLRGGNGTILDIEDFEGERFEAMMRKYPKILLRFASLSS
jgi:threonine 3-dehydrogenase